MQGETPKIFRALKRLFTVVTGVLNERAKITALLETSNPAVSRHVSASKNVEMNKFHRIIELAFMCARRRPLRILCGL